MKRLILLNAVILVTLCFATPVSADIKVRIKQTSAGQSFENSTYIKGKRRRTESANGTTVSITQCDTRRDIRLNPAARTFSVSPFGTAVGNDPGPTEAASAGRTVRGGTVTLTSTVRDTGERKQLFGYTARRILSTVVYESSADACSVMDTRIETDGWYIDDDFGFDCEESASRPYAPPAGNTSGCRDRFVTKTSGTAKKGFPVLETTTIYADGGRDGFTMTNEVVELSKADLDPALFEVPDGYSQVENETQLYDISAMMRSAQTGRAPVSDSPAMPVPTLAADAESRDLIGEKRAGVIRIGLATVRVTATGEQIDPDDLAVAIRNTFVEYLKTPDVEVVLLEANVPAAAALEAEKFECDAILFGQAGHKKGGGGFGGVFGKVIAPSVASAGLGQTGSAAGSIAGQAATVAIVNAGVLAANVKAKDEISIELRLVRADGTSVLTKQYKRKAKSNGEDLITPIVEEAAGAVVSALAK